MSRYMRFEGIELMMGNSFSSVNEFLEMISFSTYVFAFSPFVKAFAYFSFM